MSLNSLLSEYQISRVAEVASDTLEALVVCGVIFLAVALGPELIPAAIAVVALALIRLF